MRRVKFTIEIMISFSTIFTLAFLSVLLIASSLYTPVVAVISESMSPVMHRGDLVVLSSFPNEILTIDDIIVFRIAEREIPIIHRIVAMAHDGRMLTKGDNNWEDDRGLYSPNQPWVARNDVVGKAIITIPGAGYASIFLHENPVLFIFILCLFVWFEHTFF